MNKSLTIKTISWLLPFCVLLIVLLFPKPFVVIVACSVWFGYMAYVGIAYRSQIYELLTQVFTMFSLLWLLFLVESVALRWFLVFLSIPLFFFLIWMNSEHTGRLVHIKEKPLRRMRMMAQVFNMYATSLAYFAINVYFPQVPFVVLLIIGGIYAATLSLLIWKLYFKLPAREFIFPLVITAFGTAQILWVLQLMPFGYLSQGLLAVWIWYIGQLLFRFHLSPRGIIWKEQIAFLIMNLGMFIGVLFLIRWV